jgi:predicted MFS family arabinose efflux permease
MGFAVVSSVHTPCCISLINDYFQHENRARANSVYVAAISIGVGFANLTSFINEAVGWRDSILIVTSIGLVVTVFILFLREPLRQSDRGTQEQFESQVEKRIGTTSGHHLSRASRVHSYQSDHNSSVDGNFYG